MATILRLKHHLLSLFGIAFASCYLSVLIISFLYPLIFKHNHGLLETVLSLALFALIVILFFLAVYRWLARFTDPVITKISAGLFFIMLLFEGALIIAFHSIMPPIIDGGHTYAEALYLLAHGHASGSIYFQIYPNNIPVTLLRYFLYHVCGFAQIASYMIIDRTFCALILFFGIFLSWKLVRELFDARMACIFLLFTMTCLPLFLYTMYFYTDTAAIAFPVSLLYLWYLYRKTMKIRYMLLLGMTLGIGYLIRPNLILFLPALSIYMFFVLKWKKVLINLAIIGILIGAFGIASQKIEHHFGYVPNASLSMPSMNWIMLGLSRDGGYNRYDYELIRHQPNQAAKKQVASMHIKKETEKYGLPGLIRLWGIKAARTWGVGAHGYYWYTHLSSHPTNVYQYLFNHKNQVTLFIIQVFYIVNIFLLVLSVFRYFRTKKADLNLLIQLCLFGNFVFYVFVWEAEPRYSLLFTPFILLGSMFGFEELTQALTVKKEKKLRFALQGKTLRLILTGSLLAAVILCAYMGFYAYTQIKSPQRTYIVDQRYSVGNKGAAVDAHHPIVQTFHATERYNRISFGIRRVKRKGTYHVVVTRKHTGKIIFSKRFRISKPLGRLTFKLNHATPASGEDEIRISQVKGESGSSLIFAMSGKGYGQRDAYPGGRLIQRGIHGNKKDLQFNVYQTANQPYISECAYLSLFILPILMLFCYASVALTMDETEASNKDHEQMQRSKAAPAVHDQRLPRTNNF
ncbi:glycosyltransferase family 39 protein [Sporolactobacillus nakayamae]|uniref:Dolichyl-phosphate-mannose-protein mannosyltransferase n=1 Tax=Sporolactobacillus nakayamae TaxID=269670 RepID=A0A1I2T3R9_9BACL|nr:glycosyltransferase family 39 protein [Sporolactobacillus nakayamae]SFG57056.1 Dolichyl-phosphate-mannose-protein mannosyltransferase [Sporolactobacillus nakayamae]